MCIQWCRSHAVHALKCVSCPLPCRGSDRVEGPDLQTAVQLAILPRATLSEPQVVQQQRPPPPPPPRSSKEQEEEEEDREVRQVVRCWAAGAHVPASKEKQSFTWSPHSMVRAHVPQSAHFKGPASQQNQDQRDQQQPPPDEQQVVWVGPGCWPAPCHCSDDCVTGRGLCASSKLPAVCRFSSAVGRMLGYCCHGHVLPLRHSRRSRALHW